MRVNRWLLPVCAFAALLYNCGPDKPRTCAGDEPAFEVVLRLTARPLPADLVMHVAYAGSAMEEYRLSDPDARLRVTFCSIADENGVPFEASVAPPSGAAGSAGAAGATAESSGVPSLYCKLYTAGFTTLEVSGTGFKTLPVDLRRDQDQCTIHRDLTLDMPDAG